MYKNILVKKKSCSDILHSSSEELRRLFLKEHHKVKKITKSSLDIPHGEIIFEWLAEWNKKSQFIIAPFPEPSTDLFCQMGNKMEALEFFYTKALKKNLISGVCENIILPKSNVIELESDDGCKIILRPSGTEPKIKMYISVNEALNNINEFEKVDKILNDKIDRIIKSIGL